MSNIASAFYSFQQLTKLSWDGTSPIQDHIAKIRTIDSHLSGMKLGVDTKLMAFALLQSLPCTPEWQIFQSSVINTIEENKLTLDAVEIRITAELKEKWSGKGQKKKGKERHKDKGKEKEKANTAEQSSGSDSEEEQTYLVSEPDKTKTTIIIDSGATSHIVPHCSWFESGTYHVLNPPRTISFGDESSVNAIGIGTVILQATVGKKDYNIALSNVLLQGQMLVKFKKKKELILTALHKRGLYHIQAKPKINPESAFAAVDLQDIDTITRTPEFCEPCALGKMKKLPFKPTGGN
ncbi:hypothetical protein SERLA73DRAFT_78390 [Serpula lacrymans var. lacrymans S7.3]|uniref:Retrovirus-related Pol polyprotein from transposon TNT 1-94-like beta-barrel domain-containing protein n=1 Tax=Serpula lacrymans var. lacrymans (strain S7.3) TaxID=936435 RepID=F8QD00_SERL3|nr:hypothetical protein SERLA73DRAFT_78390 [Serpula lacrymans var. lacrymans S7.3]